MTSTSEADPRAEAGLRAGAVRPPGLQTAWVCGAHGGLDSRGGAGSLAGAPDPVMRFAALGDSVTLGIGDQLPQGGWRGWAALLAGSLAPPDQVELCNLARSGALVRDVASEQLPLALSVRPAVASVLVGVNDTLRGKFDSAAIAADLENIVAALQHAGTVVLTASLPDPGLLLRIPASMRRPLARRAHEINAALGQLAVRYDLVHVDLAARPRSTTGACGAWTGCTPASAGTGCWPGCSRPGWRSGACRPSPRPIPSRPTPSRAPGGRPTGWRPRGPAGWSGDPGTCCPGCSSWRWPNGGTACAVMAPAPMRVRTQTEVTTAARTG